MTLISIQNVSKFYAGHTALNDVSFDIPKGSVFGLLGPNGAGKTSLIRIINQITAADEGNILFNGEVLNKEHVRHMGYLPEERGLYKKMPVYEQLIYFARLRGLNATEARNRVNYWLEKFGATDWKKKKIEELSKGMQQKIQFIITVLHQPDFIILDEPFTGFDPANTQLIRDEIKELQKNGATLVLSTHRMESVEEICDHLAFINKAQLVAEGKVEDIRNGLKENIYELHYKGDESIQHPVGIEVISATNSGNKHIIRFRYRHDTPPDISVFNSLNIRITAYREIIPGMQEVFLTLIDPKYHA